MSDSRKSPERQTRMNAARTAGRQLPLLMAACVAAVLLALVIYPPSATQALSPEQPAAATAPARVDNLAGTPSIWPINGVVTSTFGWRTSPFGDGSELHSGIDIAIHSGAPVVATADGRVTQSGPAGGYGILVQVDHGNGLTTLYGHNSKVAVSVGQQVKKGQVISYAGSTGRSTGPHVHYEVRQHDTAIDPWRYLLSNQRLSKS